MVEAINDSRLDTPCSELKHLKLLVQKSRTSGRCKCGLFKTIYTRVFDTSEVFFLWIYLPFARTLAGDCHGYQRPLWQETYQMGKSIVMF